MAISKGKSRVARRPLDSTDAANRADIRKQQLDMALKDPQPGLVEKRRGSVISDAKGQEGQTG